MRFLLVAASAAVALLSALASLLGWTRRSGYESESDEDDVEKIVGGDATSTPSPRARRRKTQKGKHHHRQLRQRRSACQLAGLGLSVLWDAFTGRYLARTTRDLWRGASRSPQPQRRSSLSRKSE